MTQERKRIGDLLVEAGKIDKRQLALALERQKRWGKKLGETLVDLNFLTEIELARILGKYFSLPTLDLDKIPTDPKAIRMTDGDFCKKHHLVPVTLKKISGKERLVVATSDPSDLGGIDDLRFRVNVPVALAVATISAIQRAIIRSYFPDTQPDEITITKTVKPEDEKMEVIRGGRLDMLKFTDQDNVGVPATPTQVAELQNRFRKLVEMLAKRGLLTEEEVEKFLKGI